MAVQYALFPNKLKDDGAWRAVIQKQRTYDLEDIIDIMVDRGSTVSRSDALASITEYHAAILDVLADGGAVKTPLMYMAPSVGGDFEGPQDRFHPSRHKLRFNSQPGPDVEQAKKEVKIRKVSATPRRPDPRTLLDIASGSVNEQITPGRPVTLTGHRLKVDSDDPEQGVFLVPKGGGKSSTIRIERLARNMPSELIFTLPDELPAGEYRLEVRAQMRFNTKISFGRLDAVLAIP